MCCGTLGWMCWHSNNGKRPSKSLFYFNYIFMMIICCIHLIISQQWFTMINLHISYIKKAANVILNNTLHRLHACLSFFYQLNTKEDTLKNDGNLTIAGSHWLELFSILCKPMSTVNCLVAHSLQYIFLCVQQKTETHTGLEQLEAVLLIMN